MPSPRRDPDSSIDQTGAIAQPHPRRAARVGLLHVLISPARDRRELLTTLTALSAARDPRLVILAALPDDAQPGAYAIPDQSAWPGRAPRLVRTADLDDPFDGTELGPDSVVFLLRAGAVPPRGWCETLLAHARPPGIPGSPAIGGEVRAVAAESWVPLDPNESPALALQRWSEDDRAARRSWYRIAEDRPQLEAPLIALFHPAELRGELASWWRSGCTRDVRLALEAHPTARHLVAKDLLVFGPPEHATSPPLRAALASFSTERDFNYPERREDVTERQLRLEARFEFGPDPAAALELAHLALATGQRAAAIAHARACLDHWPACAEAQLLLARGLKGSGQLDAARRMLEGLFDAGPLEPGLRASIFATLANYWLQRGDPDQARPCVDSALVIDADHPVARYAHARLMLACGAFEKALEDLEATVRRVPLVPDMWYELGRTRLLAGLEASGRSALRRALELAPNHEGALVLLERLDPAPGERR
ncbi:MAG: tetratricopeptide repeat protein [Planctomycetota bacterium]|nr:tetratricopeptide repeat protein [Planctomycetota bacterium]